MRLKPFSELILGLSVIAGFSGCGASAKQHSEAAPAAKTMIAAELPKSAPHAAAAQAAEPLDEEVCKPATVAEAAEVIDLSTFPLLPGVQETTAAALASMTFTERVVQENTARVLAKLEYEARLDMNLVDVRTAYEFQRRNLLERQWKELSDSQISAGNADGLFSRSGFLIYVTVQLHDEPGKVVVRLQNFSNVNVSKLPVPSSAKFRDVSYNVANFETTAGVKETREEVRKLLLEQGWQPYGLRGDCLDLKQNGVLLTAKVAPQAQPGKTRIAYWTVQMSADLPAPADADSIEYDDEIKRLRLIALGSSDEVAAYYQTALAPAQWKAMTEKPVNAGRESFMIFRNPANDLLRLDLRESRIRMQTRVTLQHQSAAEVEETERRTKGPELERN